MDFFPIPENIADILSDNATCRAMESGTKWGDMVYMTTTTTTTTTTTQEAESVTATPPPSEPIAIQITDEDYGWEMPELLRREHIWNTFPVTLIPLGKDATGAERHSVQWHLKNLMAGRNEPDFDEYVETTQRRLLKALNASSKWVTLDAETDEWVQPDKTNTALYPIQKEICIIRMVFLPHAATVAEVSQEAETVAADEPTTTTDGPVMSAHSSSGPKPVLKKLNDIKFYFHVVWDNKTTGNPNIYTIKIHNKNVREAGLNAKQHATDLMAALKISPSWRVLSRIGDELCRIELPAKC